MHVLGFLVGAQADALFVSLESSLQLQHDWRENTVASLLL